jgi:hypothetical protein
MLQCRNNNNRDQVLVAHLVIPTCFSAQSRQHLPSRITKLVSDIIKRLAKEMDNEESFIHRLSPELTSLILFQECFGKNSLL